MLAAAAAGLFSWATASAHSKDWINRFNPVANPAAVVTHGNARFTVLTGGTVRMEYEDAAVFDDEASIAILHRHLPAPAFTHSVKAGVLTLTTASWKLTYDLDASKGPGFTATSLRVQLLVAPFSVWVPGAEPKGNMHGTIRTLDRVGHAVDLKCPPVTSQMVYYTVRIGGAIFSSGSGALRDLAIYLVCIFQFRGGPLGFELPAAHTQHPASAR